MTETLSIKVPPGALGSRGKLLALWERGLVVVSFSAEREKPALLALMERYSDIPASIADASLVRLSEIHSRCKVWPLDAHFRIYRRNSRQAIPLLIPG